MKFRHLLFPVLTACAIAWLGSSPAVALTMQTMDNANPDGSAKFVDPDQQMPFGDMANHPKGTSPHIIKLPDLDAPSHDTQSKASTLDGPWEAWRKRLLFGPFKHFGYGDHSTDR